MQRFTYENAVTLGLILLFIAAFSFQLPEVFSGDPNRDTDPRFEYLNSLAAAAAYQQELADENGQMLAEIELPAADNPFTPIEDITNIAPAGGDLESYSRAEHMKKHLEQGDVPLAVIEHEVNTEVDKAIKDAEKNIQSILE